MRPATAAFATDVDRDSPARGLQEAVFEASRHGRTLDRSTETETPTRRKNVRPPFRLLDGRRCAAACIVPRGRAARPSRANCVAASIPLDCPTHPRRWCAGNRGGDEERRISRSEGPVFDAGALSDTLVRPTGFARRTRLVRIGRKWVRRPGGAARPEALFIGRALHGEKENPGATDLLHQGGQQRSPPSPPGSGPQPRLRPGHERLTEPIPSVQRIIPPRPAARTADAALPCAPPARSSPVPGWRCAARRPPPASIPRRG